MPGLATVFSVVHMAVVVSVTRAIVRLELEVGLGGLVQKVVKVQPLYIREEDRKSNGLLLFGHEDTKQVIKTPKSSKG